MLSAAGIGGITPAQIVTRLLDRFRKPEEENLQLTSEVKELKELKTAARKSRPTHGIRVKGVDNVMVRFARCCNPVPGDEILGYITRGRGVSVHRADCNNLPVVDDSDESNRLIEVEWETSVDATYNVEIEILGHDRRGLLNDVLQVISESKTIIAAVSGRSDKNKIAHINITILIRNTDHLHSIVEKIKRVKDIFSVQRIMQ